MKLKKRKNLWLILAMACLYLVLFASGKMAAGPSGYTGLGDSTDLSSDDQTLVFPYYQNGDASLYTANLEDGEAKLFVKPEEGFSYIRPIFAPHSQSIAFLKKWEEEESTYQQLMYKGEGKVRSLTEKKEIVLDAAFAPDGKSLYYTSEKNHNQFGFFRINLKTGKTTTLDPREEFGFTSLHVVNNQKIFYHASSEPFKYDDQLKFVNLETDEQTPVRLESSYESEAGHGPALSYPTPSPNGDKIVFSDVASTTKNGTYRYDLFIMDSVGQNIEQLTNFQKYASSPVFFHNSARLVITLDKNFGGREPDREYWIIDQQTKDRKEIVIHMPE